MDEIRNYQLLPVLFNIFFSVLSFMLFTFIRLFFVLLIMLLYRIHKLYYLNQMPFVVTCLVLLVVHWTMFVVCG